MPFWDQTIEILRESIFAYSQVCHGNVGYGILIVTFLARLALLPLGIRLARAAQVQQRAMERIRPQLEALRVKYTGNSRRLAEETQRLMAREGISAVPVGGCLGSLAQVPVFIALYSAVRQAATAGGRFLWIGDLAKPDALLTMVATALTVAATPTGLPGASSNRSLTLFVTGAVTAVALSKMAAGVGLYWGLSSLFGAVQQLVVQGSLQPSKAA
jgi:YidC/Oxa1 family membrane protein insertase